MNPLTYPARPINGGPLNLAPVRSGWSYEPKYNGWRALVHAPTGAMFNRHGQPLSIAAEFAAALARLRDSGLEWLDCEGLNRRHTLGKGTLVVLDAPEAHTSYDQRRARLVAAFPEAPLDPGQVQSDSVYHPPSWPMNEQPALWTALLLVWNELQARNGGIEFYEGLVAKRADSTYPVQLHSPDYEFHGWMKHRWRF